MKRLKTKASFIFVFVAIGLIFAPVVSGQGAELKTGKTTTPPNRNVLPFLTGKTNEQKAEILSRMSGPAMFRLAKIHGITTICGKNIEEKFSADKTESNRMNFADNPVATDPTLHENEPSIAVRPNNGNIIVAACHNYPVSGVVAIGTYTSVDKGMTWSGPHYLPKRFSTDTLSDPVVRYAPNSAYVYACYMSIRFDGADADIMVTRSTNNGMTWAAPKVAIPGGDWDSDGYADFLDKPWLGVHPFPDSSAANPMVYVTCTHFLSTGGTRIVFTRSSASASAFSSWRYWWWTDDRLLQGSRPIGGRGGDVLLSYYSASDDGWGTYLHGGGYFDIEVIKLSSYGTGSWAIASAVYHQPYELPYYLGPVNGSNVALYHRWWPGMFPSIAITPSGVLYIAFAADRVPGQSQTNDEDGDIFLIKSPRPYTSWGWVSPNAGLLGIGSSWAADGYPTIGVKKTANGAIVALAWEYHGTSLFNNERYDIMAVYNGPSGWRGDFLLTDVPSMSDVLFIGDYIDCGVSANPTDKVFNVIWTDRSDKISVGEDEDDVYEDILEVIY